jgi:hypothetical protein
MNTTCKFQREKTKHDSKSFNCIEIQFGVSDLEAFNCEWSACNFPMTTRTWCLKSERTSRAINWNEGTSLRTQLGSWHCAGVLL